MRIKPKKAMLENINDDEHGGSTLGLYDDVNECNLAFSAGYYLSPNNTYQLISASVVDN
jgi:hypothetical protein